MTSILKEFTKTYDASKVPPLSGTVHLVTGKLGRRCGGDNWAEGIVARRTCGTRQGGGQAV